MFAGHVGVAFALKRKTPQVSLGWLLTAALFLDLVWPVLVLLGVERFRIEPGLLAASPLNFTHYPWSHSLATTLGWACAGGAVALLWTRRKGPEWAMAAFVIALAIASHWVLDAVVHRPDLPLVPGGAARVGLGLWKSVSGTLVAELGLLLAGAAAYLAVLRRRGGSRTGLVAFVLLILLLQISAIFGPPPPSTRAIAWTALVGYPVLALLAAWLDRSRRPGPEGQRTIDRGANSL